MPTIFPSAEWLSSLQQKLNEDPRYAEVARRWEGDIIIDIQSAGSLHEPVLLYLDLWHGKCRVVEYAPGPAKYVKPAFVFSALYTNTTSILLGKLDPMTAMLTNKLKVVGSWAYVMRNVPTVLDFIRCAREITSEIL